MTALIVLGSILLVLLLLCQIPAGGSVEYSAQGLLVRGRIGPVRVTLYPAKKKKKKAAPEKKEDKPEEEPVSKPGGSWLALKEYLPLISDAAGQLRRKVCVDRLYLDFVSAASDPAAAAMAYGYANAAIGMLWPVLEQNFHIKERRIRTAVDFQAKAPTVYLYGALSLRIGQAISLGLRLAVGFLKAASRVKSNQKEQKEAV